MTRSNLQGWKHLTLKPWRHMTQFPWGILLSVRISLAFCVDIKQTRGHRNDKMSPIIRFLFKAVMFWPRWVDTAPESRAKIQPPPGDTSGRCAETITSLLKTESLGCSDGGAGTFLPAEFIVGEPARVMNRDDRRRWGILKKWNKEKSSITFNPFWTNDAN